MATVRDLFPTHPLAAAIVHAMRYGQFERSGQGALYSYQLSKG